MSLVTHIDDLAGAIRDKINSMIPRLLPPGGTSGQALVKNSSQDNDVSWTTLSGGSGVQQVFVQQSRPSDPGPWLWWVTNSNGKIINLIVNDGA